MLTCHLIVGLRPTTGVHEIIFKRLISLHNKLSHSFHMPYVKQTSSTALVGYGEIAVNYKAFRNIDDAMTWPLP